MRSIVKFLVLGLLFAPNLTFAATGVCSKDGYTVATINGVFIEERDAQKNRDALERILDDNYKGERLKVDYLHNSTHLAGFGDGLKAFKQMVEDGVKAEDYDLIEMIKEASAKVTTQKLLLVSHSQGNFYANSFYDSVVGKEGGVPPESIRIYSVATPSNHISGQSGELKYLTSGTDKVITIIPGALSPNDSIVLHDGDDSLGHNFSDVYLKYRPAEIVRDIEWSLDKLRVSENPPSHQNEPPPLGKEELSQPCIDPPKLSLIHQAQKVAFAVADPYAQKIIIDTPVGMYKGSVTIAGAGTKVITGIGNVTLKTTELAVAGVSGIGSLVMDTTAKVATVAVNTGKSVMGAVAGAFSAEKGQTPKSFASGQAAGAVLSVSQKNADFTQTNADLTQNIPEQSSQDLNDQVIKENVPAEPHSLPKKIENPPAHQNEPPPLGKEELKVAAPQSSTPANPEKGNDWETSGYYRLAPAGGGGGGVSNSENNNQTPITNNQEEQRDTTAPEAPVVSSPVSGSSFTTTSVTFSGTAEVGSTIANSVTTATTSTSSGQATWSLPLTLGQGTTTVEFTATDSAGNRSSATSVSVFVDSQSPDVSLSSATCTGTISSSACLVATTTLAFSWSSTASDVSYFTIDKNGVISTTIATSTTATATNESTYTFKVSSTDTHGNISATSTQAVTVYTMPVVINEVAWAGTEASTSDEWIELYNRTSQPVSLAGWTLYATDMSPYIPLSGTIGANSYFLIERDDNTTVNTVTADLISPFTGSGAAGLNDNGDPLTLSFFINNSTTTVDSVSGCSGTAWCAGQATAGLRRTMERYSASTAGSVTSNWSSHLGEFIMNGTDATGGAIKGTPRARNSISYLISLFGTVSSNQTLTSANSPYLVNRTSVTVSQGATLTIEPGVVVKIVSNNEPWIRVQGTINANGTAENPVVFTSFNDDDYGGDTNGDGGATTPVAGSWRRITVESTSVGSSFTHTLVRYGGNNDAMGTVAQQGVVGVDSVPVSFDHVAVEKSAYYGLGLLNSNSTVTNSRFSTSTSSSVGASGIYISGGTPTITGNNFSGNYRGMTVVSATPTVSGNTFIGNLQEAILNSGVVGSFSGNSGSGNGTNAIKLSAGTITTSGATTTLSANGLPYLIHGVATLAGNSTLAFTAGVIVKGWDSAQSNYGLISVPSGSALYSSSTVASDIVFTSMRDSTIGGALSVGLSNPAPGDWKGILVNAGGSVNLSGFTMKYAGADAMSFPPANSIYKGAIKITGSMATSSGSITNALFDNNYQSGLNLDSVSALSVSDTIFQNHTEKNNGTASGIYSLTSTSTLSNITFSGNTKDAIGSGVNALSCTNCGSPVTTPTGLFSP